jgi:replicative DNA helicase
VTGVQTCALPIFSDDDYTKISASLALLHQKRLVIADDPSLSRAERIRLAARKVKQRMGGLDLIVIDYLQLMSHGANTRNEELGHITRYLKLTARELSVPIIVLSQLSRKVEERTDKKPMMSDLRESGAIEQDADVILMTYRDDYYNPDSQFKGFAEVLIRKQRMGPLGDVRLVFQGQFSRFCDADQREFAEAAARAAQTKPARSGRRGFDS